MESSLWFLDEVELPKNIDTLLLLSYYHFACDFDFTA